MDLESERLSRKKKKLEHFLDSKLHSYDQILVSNPNDIIANDIMALRLGMHRRFIIYKFEPLDVLPREESAHV